MLTHLINTKNDIISLKTKHQQKHDGNSSKKSISSVKHKYE